MTQTQALLTILFIAFATLLTRALPFWVFHGQPSAFVRYLGMVLPGAVIAMLVAFTVNARHLFYGISMLGRFEKRGPLKPYLVFGLTDETYSLLCAGEAPDGVDKGWYDFFLTLLDQLYWIAGSLFGNLAGAALPFDSTGIDFAMTALFLVIFVEQWENAVTHLPALIGLGASVLCLLLFGADRFIPFAMVVIFAGLCLLRRLAPIVRVQKPSSEKSEATQ